jgi:hypothetical protein
MNVSELLRKAGLQNMVIEGKRYHSPLPAELEQFYCYVKDGGHCILVILPHTEGPVEEHAIPLPVKTVLKTGYSVKDGYVYCDVPYDAAIGVVCDEGDDEFDEAHNTANGFLAMENDGMLITATNYWSSDYARHGIVYFSVSAGCVRLLLPDTTSSASGLTDEVLAQTKYVIISRGTYRGQDAYEVLFEDNSPHPFVICAGLDQWDRLIAASESGRTDIAFHIYRSGRVVRKLTARFRVVNRLPCLKAWNQ